MLISVADDELLSRTAPSALYTQGSPTTVQAVVSFSGNYVVVPCQAAVTPQVSLGTYLPASWEQAVSIARQVREAYLK